jgi:diguanylate cyclase (GGDEF)-like protein/PAS domain S-box-containing protein
MAYKSKDSLETARVLVVETVGAIEERICGLLSLPGIGLFRTESVRGLSAGLERVYKNEIDAILVELSLFSGNGLDEFDKFFAAACNIPILVIGEVADEGLAIQAVGRGAQDYLLTEHLDGYSLSRAVRNAIERKSHEDALFVEQERAEVTLNSIGDAVLCTDIAGRITYLNSVAEGLTGWGREDAKGKLLAEVFRIVDGLSRQSVPDPMLKAVQENRTVGLTANCVLIRRDGMEFAIEDSAAPIHDRAGKIIGSVIVFHDVSAAREITSRVQFLAEHDAVTGLPNRLLLNDRITQAIALARHHTRSLAVMFLDLDHFKHINDSMGHASGDIFLQTIAARLLASVRSSDTVSRQGGDEFVILLSEIAHAADACKSAEKLLHAINQPHFLEGRELRVGGSIGVSIYPEDGEDAAALLKNADMAMYHAKECGRNNFQFFKPEMTVKAALRQTLEDSLHLALQRKEFLLHYQPIVNLVTGQIAGVEALLRWQHPEEGIVCPEFFIQVAEECGLIVQIGRWVQSEAFRQVREWQDAGLPAILLSINVSAVEFSDKRFMEGIRKALTDSGIGGGNVKLELTERVLMKQEETTGVVLKELKSLGVQLVVDDFGMGYSSLSYLLQFPIDMLKIDRFFVQQITDGSVDNAIVSAIIGMGQGLGYSVVAEGIETQAQRDYLQSRECEMGQGYLFSRPVPAAEIAVLLE